MCRMGLLHRVTLTLCDIFPDEESTQFKSKSSECDGVPFTAEDVVSSCEADAGKLAQGADLIVVSDEPTLKTPKSDI